MSKVAIVTDSTACIPQNLVEQYRITVIPQVLIWGEETFRDGVDITPDEFYQRLQKASTMPSSSQATPAAFREIFSKLSNEGYDILAVLISTKLSGTIDSAVQARAMLPGSTIEIHDTNSTAMGMGFQVIAAAKAAEGGASLLECKQIAEDSSKKCGIFLTVDTLEFLHRGGRIGGASRFLGTALNIKPILELREGRLEPIERVRTRRKALHRVVELVVNRAGAGTPLHLACIHANAPQDAQTLLNLANDSLNTVEKMVTDVSPVIGTHAGPGTIGLAYMLE